MPIQLDAKLNAFRRSSRGFFITLEIGPDSDWSEIAAAPLGQAFGVAMVAYDAETGKASPGAEPLPHTPDAGQRRGESGKPRQHFSQMSRAQQAGILCQDATFGLWLSKAYPTLSASDVPAAVRIICNVASRSELSEDRVAGKKWDQLVSRYRQDTGLEACQR